MNGKTYVQLISTFFMGAITGAFLYVTAFAPDYNKDTTTQTGNVSEGVIIEGEMYGACEEFDSCASFRLLQNRQYNYIPFPQAPIERGKLPSDTTKTLFDALTPLALERSSAPAPESVCDSQNGGLDFSYSITTASSTFHFDTCSTQLSKNETLKQHFLSAWDFMQNPTTTYPAILEEGPGEFIINKAFERFHEGGKSTQE